MKNKIKKIIKEDKKYIEDSVEDFLNIKIFKEDKVNNWYNDIFKKKK